MKKKNAGFSLVELIVVIAIMAVLVGVLAPAYLKYVEKSRKSSDISSISDVMGAAEKVAVDVQYSAGEGDTFIITFVGDGTITYSGSAEADAITDWKETAGDYTMKSSEFKKLKGAITGTVQDSGAVLFEYASSLADMCEYTDDFEAKFE